MQSTLAELTTLVEGKLLGDGALVIHGAAPRSDVHAGQITLVDGDEKNQNLRGCPAAAVIAPLGFAPKDLPAIQVRDVHAAFTKLLHHFPAVADAAADRYQPAGRGQPPGKDRRKRRCAPLRLDWRRRGNRRRFDDLRRRADHGRGANRRRRNDLSQRRAVRRHGRRRALG